MKDFIVPYSVPETLEPDLTLVRAYWERLKRGENDVPFWDDVKVSSLPDISERLLLIDVFEKPQRFRFGLIGGQLMERYGGGISNNFTDDVELRNPFEYLTSQCSATVESRAPTYYRDVSAKTQKAGASGSYSRMLLPLWGDGRVGMLLGATVWIERSTPARQDPAA